MSIFVLVDDQISDYKMKDGDKITLMLPKESKTRSTADEVKTSDQDVEALFYAKLRTVCLTKLPEPDVNEFLKHFHEVEVSCFFLLPAKKLLCWVIF